MKLFKMLLPYGFVYLILFYILPFAFHKNKSEINILFLIIPMLCLIISIIFGVLHGFKWFYPLLIAILYCPAAFLVFEQSAVMYIIVYAFQGLIGNFIGSLFQKH